MELKENKQYIYDDENGYYVWYNSFAEAISHINNK